MEPKASPSAASPSSPWDAGRYGRDFSFVWNLGTGVVELLHPQPGERILDLGCGLGQLTSRIAESGATVMGMDRDPAMIAQAREILPDLTFVQGDATGFAFDEPFDAIFSNAALHWVKPPEKAAAAMARALRTGGRLVVEFGGKGNIHHIVEALEQALRESGDTGALDRNPWYFPGIGEYASLLEAHGLAVTSAALFDRPTQLQGEDGMESWVRMFCAWALAGRDEHQAMAMIRRVEELTRPVLYHDSHWWADYRRLRIVAVKE